MLHFAPFVFVVVLVATSIVTKACVAFAFLPLLEASRRGGPSCPNGSSTAVCSSLEGNQDLQFVRRTLQETYPFFCSILDTNEEVWKAISGKGGDQGTEETQAGFTIFVPSNAAIQALGEKKQSQLMDVRNLETTQKIAAYHVVGEVVTSEQLYNAGGVLTVAGAIPVERSVSGGMFGIGGQEDGGVAVNTAKVIQSFPLGFGLVHEVDSFVSPNIMWRYMDQLRIPGSV